MSRGVESEGGTGDSLFRFELQEALCVVAGDVSFDAGLVLVPRAQGVLQHQREPPFPLRDLRVRPVVRTVASSVTSAFAALIFGQNGVLRGFRARDCEIGKVGGEEVDDTDCRTGIDILEGQGVRGSVRRRVDVLVE